MPGKQASNGNKFISFNDSNHNSNAGKDNNLEKENIESK